MFATAAVVLAVATAAGCGTGKTHAGSQDHAQSYRPDGSASVAPGQTLSIRMGDMYFRPNTIQARAGGTITLRLQNASPILHNFTLSVAGINRNVPPKNSVVVSFPAPNSGVYYFYCDVPGHAAAGMVGRLTVS